jgi:signal transduction histidine kinase
MEHAGGEKSPMNERSLEYSRRLRNLFDISQLLVADEPLAAALPKVLAKFSDTLALSAAVILLTGDTAYQWQAPGAPAGEAERRLGEARASLRFFTGDGGEVGEPTPPSDWVNVTLPLGTGRRHILGLVQLTGRFFDEIDLLYLSSAVNQIALAVQRGADVLAKSASSRQEVDSAVAEKTAAVAALAMAEQARRLRDDLLAMVSHDLKTPLSSILLATELIEGGGAVPEKFRTVAKQAHASAQGMVRMIGDLLDWAGIDAGTLSVTPAPVPLGSLLEAAGSLMHPLAEEKSITLDFAATDPDALVVCDEGRALQVLANLIGNAIKFSPPGSRIDVRAAPRHGQAAFTVADRGPGIPLDLQALIFERYWSTQLSSRKGHGLGLAIAKGLVEAQGGRIWVESTSGRGSVFGFTLPLAAPPAH